MTFKKFAPLIFVELYLISTLVVFLKGPIEYRIHNEFLFYLYIFLYHIFTFCGYSLGIKILTKQRNSDFEKKGYLLKYSNITLLALFSSLLSNANLSMGESLIPYNIIDLFNHGISFESIGLAYFDKIQALDSYQGNKLLNIIFFFIAWPKVIYISYVIYNWDKINIVKKILSSIIILIPVLSGISTGTNKPIFDFVLIFLLSLCVYFFSNKFIINKFLIHKRKLFVLISVIGFFFAVYFFSLSMKGRNVDFVFLESTSVLGDIKVKESISSNEINNGGVIWLVNYVVQGYYGFSLSLDQEFTSTYGFGNSPFLTRQFEWISGINLRERTYQYKIDHLWGETIQWHSFYSQFANDFHFIGVSLILFAISFLMAITWKSIIKYNNFYAKLLLPIYLIMFIFMPANNQIFGYIETLSTFVILNFFLFKTIKLQ